MGEEWKAQEARGGGLSVMGAVAALESNFASNGILKLAWADCQTLRWNELLLTALAYTHGNFRTHWSAVIDCWREMGFMTSRYVQLGLKGSLRP